MYHPDGLAEGKARPPPSELLALLPPPRSLARSRSRAHHGERLNPTSLRTKAHHSQTATKALRKFLQSEWDAKKAPTQGARTFSAATVKGFAVAVPTQSNLCDCGVFVLHFVQKFVENLPTVDTRFVESKGGDTMGKGWFNEVDIADKRIRTMELIRRLVAAEARS